MKNFKILNFMVVACLLVTVGCNDLLEEPTPPTSTTSEEVLTNPNGVESLRASLYSNLRSGQNTANDETGNFTTEYLIGPSAIADLTRNRPGSSRMQDLNNVTGNDGGTNGLSSYGSAYKLILDANLMINSVEEGVIPQEQLDRYRGEAYALRAFAMHHLVRALGYEPGMMQNTYEPGWDLGIVIRTEPTRALSQIGEVPRNTVSEVYDQILSDLSQAKTLLEGQTDHTRITEAFVDGMRARVHLYAGNWAEASSAAQEAISNGQAAGFGLVSDSAAVADMFDETAGDHPEAFFKLVVNPDTEPIAGSNVNDGPASYTSTTWVAQMPTNRVIDSYSADDNRLGWYAPCFNDRGGNKPADCDAVNDEGWELQKWGGELGNQADNIPYMRMAEMYLIQAEADAKANNSAAAGLAPLQELRDTRNAGPVPASALASVEDFEDFILEERIRELVTEGHRFWDLKRLGKNIPNPDGSTKLRYDSYRILDDIGAGNISANPALEENPGY